MKIFVVDDDEFCLNLYEQQLLSLGYADVFTFNNGQDCITALNESPEIIFLDYGMEDLDGVEVLKKIKATNSDIYVVFLSGQEDVSIAVDSLKFGAFEYIIKSNNDMLNIKIVLDKIGKTKAAININRQKSAIAFLKK